MAEQYFSDRAVGQYPLSIATSLAMESACGIHPEIKVDSPPLPEYEELWVNVKTLYRNFMGALEDQDAKSVSYEAVSESLQQEMEQIEELTKASAPNCRVVFYVSNYDGIKQRYKHATERVDNTDKQKLFSAIYRNAVKHMTHALGPNGKLKIFDLKLKVTEPKKTLILTHIAYDLLSAKEFKELVLLESHTGKLKERGQWYTKFYNGKDLAMIPFNEGFLQIFGDSETFRPQDIRFRKEILEIAEQYKWNQLTTKAKLHYGIDQMKNPYYKEVLRQMV